MIVSETVAVDEEASEGMLCNTCDGQIFAMLRSTTSKVIIPNYY